ncbi:hypothetical protein [Thermogemmatispora onikobensis]|uniref:hypothetical protein n=1 Tax=Thermogemmatispora onikobensis TaxID=732234 RepID=UPI000852C31C|nr:hypothetical protein [Thermogemmatispora onikobensis]
MGCDHAPVASGSHQSLVYIYDEGQSQTPAFHDHLVRDDVATDQRVTITTNSIKTLFNLPR